MDLSRSLFLAILCMVLQACSVNETSQLHDEQGLDELPASCPRPSEIQRYTDVPLSYANPHMGMASLYYEISANFDPRKKTQLFFLDPQTGTTVVGMANTLANENLNVIAVENRGKLCAPINVRNADGSIDWMKAYEVFKIDNHLQDIDAVRRLVLGEKERVYLWGGSGTAILALLYMSRYPTVAAKAQLMSLSADPEEMWKASRRYFEKFLDEKGLRKDVQAIIDGRIAKKEDLFVGIQWLLYKDENKVTDLVKSMLKGDFTLFNEAAGHGIHDQEVRSIQQGSPAQVVYFYDQGLRAGTVDWDILGRVSDAVVPLQALAAEGKIPSKPIKAENLAKIDAEILFVAGTLDHVIPMEETVKIFTHMPRSRLAIFEDYHVIVNSIECRRELWPSFLQGWESLETTLTTEKCSKLIEMKKH